MSETTAKMVEQTSKTCVVEAARELPVSGAWDVVVAGGGVAGVAAAVAAARSGVSVCLLERAFGVGGLATLGNVIVYLPICDGRGRQVMGGLAEELLHLSVADLGADDTGARFCRLPECWRPGGDLKERRKTRFRVDFNPSAYQLALEQLLVDAGVDLLYDTRVCAVDADGDRLRHLVVENKSGRSAVACGTVVDATGDADLAHLAGETTESLDSNVLSAWFYTLSPDGLELQVLSNSYSPTAARTDATGPFFRGDDAAQVTAQVLGSRALVRQRLAELRARSPGTDVQLLLPPSTACLRMTRRLVGAMSLGEGHMHVWFDDAVGLTGDWRRRGPVYAVPLRALLATGTRNLAVAGRCISADTSVWDATRAIPTCVLTGEAAGTAAALAVRDAGADLHEVPIGALQATLRERGGRLDPALVAPAKET